MSLLASVLLSLICSTTVSAIPTQHQTQPGCYGALHTRDNVNQRGALNEMQLLLPRVSIGKPGRPGGGGGGGGGGGSGGGGGGGVDSGGAGSGGGGGGGGGELDDFEGGGNDGAFFAIEFNPELAYTIGKGGKTPHDWFDKDYHEWWTWKAVTFR